jgi:hypothetical protein
MKFGFLHHTWVEVIPLSFESNSIDVAIETQLPRSAKTVLLH